MTLLEVLSRIPRDSRFARECFSRFVGATSQAKAPTVATFADTGLRVEAGQQAGQGLAVIG
jgi:hypothetical protein